MKQEHDRIQAITHEVISYFLDNQIYDFKFHIQIFDDTLSIEFVSELKELPGNFAEFINELKIPRDQEIGDYYFGLMTSQDSQNNNYTLLGSNIDEVDYSHENGFLRLHLVRHLQS